MDTDTIPTMTLGERLRHGDVRRWKGQLVAAIEARHCVRGDVLARAGDPIVVNIVHRDERGSSGGYCYLSATDGRTKHYDGDTVILTGGPSFDAAVPA